jgi:plastocyanin
MRHCIQGAGLAQVAPACDANRASQPAALSLPHEETNQETIMPHFTPDQPPHPRSRRRMAPFAPLIMVALLVLLAGCDATSTAGSAPPTDTVAPAATATATTATSTPVSGNAVAVEDFDFSPPTLTVKVGTTVTWTNTSDSVSHTVTSATGLFDHALSPGDKFQFKFTQVGDFHYHCKIHPSMNGTITVTAS